MALVNSTITYERPSFKDAPKWAKWLAMEPSGSWLFMEHGPQPGTKPVSVAGIWACGNGRYLRLWPQQSLWEESLLEIPE